jgi:hypothetical protein
MSNNKQSMKLYTEEEIMNYLINHKSTITRYDLQNIPHIELPSDDEIKKESLKTDFEYTFRNGVMWMRDKIQGGNK